MATKKKSSDREPTYRDLATQLDIEVSKTERFLAEQNGGNTDDMPFVDIGFMPKALVQTSLPYTRLVDANGRPITHYVRSSKNVTMTLSSADLSVGLPFGSAARLILSRLTTLAVANRTSVIELGPSVSSLVKSFGKIVGGGKRGACTAFRLALTALSSTSIYFKWHGHYVSAANELFSGQQTMLFPIVEKVSLWTKGAGRPDGEDDSLPEGFVELSPYLYHEINNGPVPFTFSKLASLAKSPMRMDIYLWATYKASYLRKPVLISWEALKSQFGHTYARMRDFRVAFVRNLKAVCDVYPALKVEAEENGLRMHPSPPDVERRVMMRIDAATKRIQAARDAGLASGQIQVVEFKKTSKKKPSTRAEVMEALDRELQAQAEATDLKQPAVWRSKGKKSKSVEEAEAAAVASVAPIEANIKPANGAEKVIEEPVVELEIVETGLQTEKAAEFVDAEVIEPVPAPEAQVDQTPKTESAKASVESAAVVKIKKQRRRSLAGGLLKKAENIQSANEADEKSAMSAAEASEQADATMSSSTDESAAPRQVVLKKKRRPRLFRDATPSLFAE